MSSLTQFFGGSGSSAFNLYVEQAKHQTGWPTLLAVNGTLGDIYPTGYWNTDRENGPHQALTTAAPVSQPTPNGLIQRLTFRGQGPGTAIIFKNCKIGPSSSVSSGATADLTINPPNIAGKWIKRCITLVLSHL